MILTATAGTCRPKGILAAKARAEPRPGTGANAHTDKEQETGYTATTLLLALVVRSPKRCQN